uniref:lysine-specific demethylase 4C-like n=1 Tax=Styela clava TaxID=7725 RepID=UPI001939C875|nr:lysine-specific demethylase 4C-like [Styela clava]
MFRKPNSECQIMVFHPTMEEFSDFSRYIQYMESQGAHRGGVAKVIPPKEWSPCKSYDNIDNLVIPAPISQVVTGQKGLYTQYNIQQKPLAVKELRRLTNTDKYSPPFHESYEDLERTYWKNITFNPAIYGADISGSLYDKDVDVWNVARLDTILDMVENDTGVKIEGVNTAYLYFGMWKTSFAWHTEDMDLYSINYVHFGAPKTWYSIPPEHGKRLERLANGFFPNSASTCPAFLRHKMTLISPSVLKRYGIPFNKITQEAGEFMITFPYGYHSGFNHGFNCAESTNFASERWIDYGLAAEKCRCQKDMVYINMDLFIRNFQPEKYELWKENKYEAKLSYQDIPDLPDFSKKPVHWRVKMKEIKLENEKQKKLKTSSTTSTKVDQLSAKKTPQKISNKSPAKIKQSPSGLSKLPCFVKLEKDFTICDSQHITNSSKKSTIKRSLSEVSSTSSSGFCLQNISQTKRLQGSSGCLNNKPSSTNVYQLNMGSVFAGFIPTTDQNTVSLDDDQSSISSQFLTLSDRIKMGRRKPNNNETKSSQLSNETTNIKMKPKQTEQSKTNQNTISPPNSDHDMYTKRLTINKPSVWAERPSTSKQRSKSYPPLPVKMCFVNKEKQLEAGSEQNSVLNQSPERVNTFTAPSLNKKVDTQKTMSSASTAKHELPQLTSINTKTKLTPEKKETKLETPSSNSSVESDLSGSEESAANFLLLMKHSQQSNSSTNSKQSQNMKEKVKESLSKAKQSPFSATRPPLKRRHPVSKKGPSKKSSPTVFLKNTSADSESSEDDLDSGTTKQKRSRGRPSKSEMKSLRNSDGYPNLWPRRKASFKTERQYNATVAKLPPHCAVCTLFCPYYKKCLIGDQKTPTFSELLEKSASKPQETRTKPLIPEINFATSVNNPAPLATCQLLDSEGKSSLIQCQVCMVQVHASCYGIVKPEKPWTCDRCSFKAWIAQCSLCCMRGGALKPVNDGLQWAHILCAVSIPEVSFDDIPLRNGINIRNLSPARQKLKCTYCKRAKKNLQSLGTCIQCCAGVCAISFHPTCAHAAGVKMETGDWPLPVFVYCHRHALQKERAMDVKSGKNLPDVAIGQTVFGKHRNGRYYPCVIRSETSQNFHHVIFSDNSWSDNLYQEDIISHTFETTFPREGDKLSVKWTDGKIYEASYVQCKKHQVLMVEFEDASFLSIKREDMYTTMDEMPRRIKRKLSNATLMAKSDYLESPKKLNSGSFVSQRAAFNEKRKKMANAATEIKTTNADESHNIELMKNNDTVPTNACTKG